MPKIEVNINGQLYMGLMREEHFAYSKPGIGVSTHSIIDLYDSSGVNTFGSIEVSLDGAVNSGNMFISLISSKD